ncbi:MAG: hypothetical protein A3C93_06585 [Candidatus Lloydbacteria bacterium RIFCSPHIGHO2_02_FULL_54_17]|uniref:Uncharacterized protein n=1 Tax=Candidatus Lloydbacteria bacterium RIFCSPHIGHO2_02_FULL_54_17 TaxID=1798664 RepID=A0A1G2DC42_9BACT|nr:MAG: hypothetical protein A2762_05360 [Candidatus Lloydbacteria bacterium RIFCSPHIGHO2_01_FULL_54_11]OGZ11166.1 MAG: hypothetical protein A3C93_06585 [Candidatus Lloydbacteria bacterium RIFCSPHIGHO2_02_FULL_54_17]OGZ14979.1 MAG: hypothetical protein A2948_00835 [Candidatus Lloydbacteria bacterium RIFCSPLOWO2_01_FULL_54_18]OGZ15269.1 MAG: hypothetical protein A3H76_03255 [Candidatus Lloydbacteria bacterium RIFCSPLOWO2_02_FULL_54_12]
MGNIVQLHPETRMKDHLVTEFIDQMRRDKDLNYLEIGAARERIEKTLNRLFFFLIRRRPEVEKVGYQLKTMTHLLECEWVHLPIPSAKEIAEKAIPMLLGSTAHRKREGGEAAEALPQNVVAFFPRERRATPSHRT